MVRQLNSHEPRGDSLRFTLLCMKFHQECLAKRVTRQCIYLIGKRLNLLVFYCPSRSLHCPSTLDHCPPRFVHYPKRFVHCLSTPVDCLSSVDYARCIETFKDNFCWWWNFQHLRPMVVVIKSNHNEIIELSFLTINPTICTPRNYVQKLWPDTQSTVTVYNW